jgi:hypothetical protein
MAIKHICEAIEAETPEEALEKLEQAKKDLSELEDAFNEARAESEKETKDQ